MVNADMLKDIATRYTAAWCSHDAARVASFYAPDGSITINAGIAAVGRTAVAATAQAFMTTFPDLVVRMDNLRQEGAKVVYQWTASGTNSGPGGNGNAVRFSGREEWTLQADGLIAASRGYYDEADYQRQMMRAR
jgi:steroid delta-isomerase-like uncharacterized protein